RRAQEKRVEAEKSLSTVRGEIADLEQHRDNASAQLDDIKLKLNDDNRRLQELCAASNAPPPSPQGEPVRPLRSPTPRPPNSSQPPLAGPTPIAPRQPATTAPRASTQQ